MTPAIWFMYLLATAGGLVCILSVAGVFWLLRLYVIGMGKGRE